ncbi:YdcH family protein [Orbaceae bacterium ESL0721]|nr:YdcH family protein [Orbaceae bacterium ESL0721]
MFPEYRDLISKIKNSDLHFQKLFDQHNEIDQQIKNITSGIAVETNKTVEELKKEKLKLKDEMYSILQKAADKLRN